MNKQIFKNEIKSDHSNNEIIHKNSIDKFETDKKNSRNKKEKKKLGCLGIFLALIITIITIGILGASFIIIPIILDVPGIEATDLYSRIDESSLILDHNGNVIDKLQGNEFRTTVDSSDISNWVKLAVVAIEDERFYEHNGIDFKRLIGALVHDIKTRSLEQGASTINMQLSKNIYTSADKSFKRKIKDMYIALKIDKILSKDEILTAYLNTSSFSRGNLGVEAAAKSFFNKSALDLTLAESALIAGITQNPSKYTPYKTALIDAEDDISQIQITLIPSTESSLAPTDEDLELYSILYKEGYVDVYQYDQLKNGHTYVRKAVLNSEAKKRQELVLLMMLNNNFINEEQYENAVKEEIILELGKIETENISSYFIDAAKAQVLKELENKGYTREEANDLMINGGLKIHTTLDINIQNMIEAEIENSSNFPSSYRDENGLIQPQTAIVIIDQYTGHIKAMVGGRGIGGDKIYNRALNPRQPGSAIKPLAVYLPALENGLTAATTVKDGPRPNGDGTLWPKNSTGYRGLSTMTAMVWNSSNVAAVEFMNEIGISTSIESLQKQGFSTIITSEDNFTTNDENLSLALGGMTYGTTPLELTSGFATVANQGQRMTPYYFTIVEDRDGNILLEAPTAGEEIFSAGNSYIMTSMLKQVVTKGTGKTAAVSGMTVAGKTGTTSDKKDAWFVGYSPYYTAGVWIGTDQPTALSDHSRMAARLWSKIMTRIHSDLENKDFEIPEGVSQVRICTISGLRPSETCPTELAYFVDGTAPKTVCTSHSGSDAIGSNNYVTIKEDEEDEEDNKDEEKTDSLITPTKPSKPSGTIINIPGIGDIVVPSNGIVDFSSQN